MRRNKPPRRARGPKAAGPRAVAGPRRRPSLGKVGRKTGCLIMGLLALLTSVLLLAVLL
ncbi:MAG: hypothetical protein HZA58_03005 [Acidimicrobiia bacterium]|nr:hypothetical protein [Acidimicrobiia bacterium]